MLHGDVSSGGPASDNVPLTQRIAAKNPGLAVAALIRLGYPDGADNASVGNNFNRIDQYPAFRTRHRRRLRDRAARWAQQHRRHVTRQAVGVGCP
jgi:hypothetical protein